MRIPYGIADFQALREEGRVYVDRTDRIPLLEEMGKALLFLRPRRFGKSLLLSTLAAYYDLRTAERHDRLFEGLAVAEAPTPGAHRYFVMRWDFSGIDPDPPRSSSGSAGSRPDRIGAEIHRYLNSTCETFLTRYSEHLPDPPEMGPDAFTNLDRLLAAVEQTPYRLYLLIDEYDNFANEILTADQDTYEELVHGDGPFKHLFKWVKSSMAGSGLDRLFITGVSPLVMSDVTSGMNIARGVFLHSRLADLCGFTEAEVDDLLAAALRRRGDFEPAPEEARTMLREWYNGYRFALGVSERVYNPTLVFYFLLHLLEEGASPDQMLDANLAADEGKLEYLARLASGRRVGEAGSDEMAGPERVTLGRDTVVDLISRDEPLEVRQLLDHFTLRELLEHEAQDLSFFASYLFYFGMLTLRKDRTETQTVELVVPNEVVHGLYVERVRKILMPLGASRSRADSILFAFLRDGELEPLLDFIESSLFPVFSNRDAGWANELTVKTVFLSLLWNDVSYITYSEPELEHRYADLCLLRRPDSRASGLWDLLFEFKRLPLKALGMTGEEIKAMGREELAARPAIREALNRAENQVREYRSALERSRGDSLKLRAYAVVSLGFERLVARRC